MNEYLYVYHDVYLDVYLDVSIYIYAYEYLHMYIMVSFPMFPPTYSIVHPEFYICHML